MKLLLVLISICLGIITSAQKVAVPEWAKEVIWYQIFPERFNNGYTTNDPEPSDLEGAWPHDNNEPFYQ